MESYRPRENELSYKKITNIINIKYMCSLAISYSVICFLFFLIFHTFKLYIVMPVSVNLSRPLIGTLHELAVRLLIQTSARIIIQKDTDEAYYTGISIPRGLIE